MKTEFVHVLTAVAVGSAATAILDLWGLFLNRALNFPAPNYCLVGRWFRYMPDGVFKHQSIAASPEKRMECAVGWTAHYLIGIVFALGLVLLASPAWLEQPTPLPALLFGVATVALPYFIMQPAFGLGVAASKTSNPKQARLRNLISHAVFGVGLYVAAVILNPVILAFAR